MNRSLSFALIALVAGVGCADATGSADSAALQTSPTPEHVESWEGCPSQGDLSMYDATDASIHELVTCGGMQVKLANNMLAILLVSNDRMYDDATRDDLQELSAYLPKNPFERLDKQTWQVQMGPGSTFTMKFIDPSTGRPITVDPFDMESYLIGLRASYEMTFEEMWTHPARQNRWVFTWDRPGPLAHLVNDGEPVPERFEMQLSLNDLIDIVYGAGGQTDLGLFDSILDVEMQSEVHLEDSRPVRMSGGFDDAVVRYDVGIRRQSVRSINAGAALDFDVRELTTTLDNQRLEATESTLHYGAGGVGLLAGLVAFDTPRASVESDFAEGARYPEQRWSCE